MKIAVLIKQIADVEGYLNIDRNSCKVSSPNMIVNPVDMSALEEAVRIKERIGDTEVTAISLGSDSAEKALRDCLKGGADRVVHINDREPYLYDSYAAGTILAKAVNLEGFDLVICGHRAADTQAGIASAVVADKLSIPLVTDVVQIEFKSQVSDLMLTRKLEAGRREVLKVSIPVVITVSGMINEPRYPSLRAIKESEKKPVIAYSLEELGCTAEEIEGGLSMTSVVALSPARPSMQRLFTPDNSLPAARRMYLIMQGGISEKKTSLLSGSPEETAAQFVDLVLSSGDVK